MKIKENIYRHLLAKSNFEIQEKGASGLVELTFQCQEADRPQVLRGSLLTKAFLESTDPSLSSRTTTRTGEPQPNPEFFLTPSLSCGLGSV